MVKARWLCSVPKAVKKKRTSNKLKSVVEAKNAQNNSEISEGGITVKPGQDSIHELIIGKVNPFVSSVTCSRYQIVLKWLVNFDWNFLVYNEMENISMDEIFSWTFLKFKKTESAEVSWWTRMCIHCSLCKQKYTLKSTTTNGWRHFWPIGTAQIIYIVSYPIRKKSRFWPFCMWSVKGLYHALLLKTDYTDKGRGHDRRLSCYLLPHYSVLTQEKNHISVVWLTQEKVTNLDSFTCTQY